MRDRWSSRLMFILVSAGSAIGIGNIWRFPYMAGEQGGGTFILLYLVFVLLFALPAVLIEILAGAIARQPMIQGFRELIGKAWPVSLLPLITNWVIMSYYIVITGWVLYYFIFSISGSAPVFEEAADGWGLVIAAFATFFIAAAISTGGIKKGIERLNLYLFPVFILALLFLFLNSLFLGGIEDALAFMTTVDLDSITPGMILAAVTQAIFSLSIGLGIMFTYGGYLSRREQKGMFGSVGAIVITDTSVALLSAVTIFAITFTFGLSPAAGPALAFETLPIAFANMPFGNFIMPLFFLMLFCAALTSLVSAIEVMVRSLSVMIRRRIKQVAVGMLLVLILFVPAALSYSPIGFEFFGMPALDFLDGVLVERLAPIATIGMIIGLVWFWKKSRRIYERTFTTDLGDFYYLVLKYALPIILVVELI